MTDCRKCSLNNNCPGFDYCPELLRIRVEELKQRVQEAEAKQQLDQNQCDSMTEQAATLAVKVAELTALRNEVFEFLMSADGTEETRMTALHMLNR